MILALASLILSALPVLMFLANLDHFRILNRVQPDQQHLARGPGSTRENPIGVSVLIPARDESSGIAECVLAAVESSAVTVEVIVLDDQSTDETASIVESISNTDSRVRLVRGRQLPEGWNGKQFACRQLADAASHDRLVFIDADVRLQANCLARLIEYQDHTCVSLLSAFPHQQTGSWLEKWLIPMMHFILLGYLPFARMRRLADPSLSAGCGQLFVTTREAYQQAGTHEAIKSSRHDGVKLPRAYRRAGLMSDVVDGTSLAACRMYCNAGEVTRGILKNASEGIANARLIVPFTILLLGCSILPIVAFVLAYYDGSTIALCIATVAGCLAHLPRLIAAVYFRQSWFGAICHVPATVLFVSLQWIAFVGSLTGHRVAWRGRE